MFCCRRSRQLCGRNANKHKHFRAPTVQTWKYDNCDKKLYNFVKKKVEKHLKFVLFIISQEQSKLVGLCSREHFSPVTTTMCIQTNAAHINDPTDN